MQTIVCVSGQPTAACWRWAQSSPIPTGNNNHGSAAVAVDSHGQAAMAKFKYPAECVAHRCPGHAYMGPLYYGLKTVGTLPTGH